MQAVNELDQLRQKILNSETFCFYPYVQLSTSPGGLLKPCCNYMDTVNNEKGSGLNIFKGDSFNSAWNSFSMVKMREDMFNEKIPNNCARCIRDGKTGMRARSVDEYKNDIKTLQFVQDTANNNFVAEHSPTYLELKPSNLCNLKCVMCNSYDSSQIKKELHQLNEKYPGIHIKEGRFIKISDVSSDTIKDDNKWLNFEDVNWEDNETVWTEFEKLAPSLEVLSFAGGEPTIMPSVIKALTFCVEHGYAKNIKVFLSSNFTNLNKSFFELMPNFKKFELIASIDGAGKVQEYCRFPSNWNQVSKNYIEAKKYMKYPNVKILVNITISMFNIVNLTDLLYWIEDRANEYPYYSEWPYNINIIYYPLEQQLFVLPDHLKELAITRLKEYSKKSQILKEFPGMEGNINLLITELTKQIGDNRIINDDMDLHAGLPQEEKDAALKKLRDLCINRIKVLDEHRGVDFKTYIPDIAEFIDAKME